MASPKGFALTKLFVEFTHMNTRIEKSGPDNVSAVDLSMGIQMENDVLDPILPGLRSAFYGRPGKDAGDLADQGKADQLIRLKYPALASQTLDTEWPNYELRFHYGLDDGGDSDIVLEDCTVKGMKLELHDGGTVDLAWKVAAHPTDDQYADLQERLRTRKVEITLVKPKVTQKQKGLLDNEPVANPVAAAAGDEPVAAANDGPLPEAWPFPPGSEHRVDPNSSLG